ncbi:hypothetical protein HYFRA_00000916 [Hymenoscyphus fraxineus]|uniref:NAD(P)-binding protein n=1 Tax=Hymenoscyphus fraxineus TaxID=746836 RepID=A0A9N9PS52_9HELO|nr:hypothetical protein HYFRA_00000916 [Hymenoscyphus fraxineus]
MSPKSVLITGSSAGGIGSAIALKLARYDPSNHIFATARNTSKISEELSSLPNVTVIQLDVLSEESVAAALQVVTDSGIGLDVLLNNAGTGYAMPILDVDIEKGKELYEANVWGPIRLIKAFSGLLIASRGRIVNMSSVGALVNTPWIGVYGSSKAALVQLSETLRLELSPFGVEVTTIMGGVVDSKFHANDEFTLPANSRYASIEEIIASWASGEAKPKGCSAETFAETLVEDIVGDGKGKNLIYRGPHAGMIKFMTEWFPTFMVDSFMSKGQGLKELSDEIVKGK